MIVVDASLGEALLDQLACIVVGEAYEITPGGGDGSKVSVEVVGKGLPLAQGIDDFPELGHFVIGERGGVTIGVGDGCEELPRCTTPGTCLPVSIPSKVARGINDLDKPVHDIIQVCAGVSVGIDNRFDVPGTIIPIGRRVAHWVSDRCDVSHLVVRECRGFFERVCDGF